MSFLLEEHGLKGYETTTVFVPTYAQQAEARHRKDVDVCSFVRHRCPSSLEKDGGWWLRFAYVFSEDEMMCTMILAPPHW